MGPGPANVSPRVMAAHTLPLLGHMHPPFFRIMDEIQQGLRYVFQTDSPYTLLVSGTGHAGMEACIANLIEPGEKIVVGNKGIWGARVTDLASRYGGRWRSNKSNEHAGSLLSQSLSASPQIPWALMKGLDGKYQLSSNCCCCM